MTKAAWRVWKTSKNKSQGKNYVMSKENKVYRPKKSRTAATV